MMQQLDKWNKELEQLSKKRYKQMDNQLYNAYKDGLKQLKLEIKQYIDAYDSLSFSQRLQVERQLEVAAQINDIINEMGGKEERLLRSFISDEGTQGYFGTFYALESAENVQISFAMLPKDYISELVNTPVAGKRLSTRLYTNQSKLAQETTTALLQGAFRGEGYAKVAKSVGELTEANYKQALRIARTEGGRMQSFAKQRSYVEAKNKGIDIQKRWLSTLDKKTRHSHQELDGQTVDVEEQFEYKGLKADAPRLFGVAAQDINCRCTTITVVNGIEPELRKDNETKGITGYNNYNEWAIAKGYKQAETIEVTPKKPLFDALAIMGKTNMQNMVGDDNYNQFIDHLNGVDDERMQELYSHYGGQINYYKIKNGKGSFANRDGVQLNTRDFEGHSYSNPLETVYHENGHALDRFGVKAITGKETYSDGTTRKVKRRGRNVEVENVYRHASSLPQYNLKETIDREMWEYINGDLATYDDLGKKPRKKSEKAIWEEESSKIYRTSTNNAREFLKRVKPLVKENPKRYTAFADMAESTGVIGNDYPLGYGHGKKYWTNQGSTETEFFAHVSETIATNPEGYEMLQEVFPKSVKIWEQIVDDIIKGVD